MPFYFCFLFVGAQRYGRRWKIILNAYPFQSGRTPIDLKDKYKKLKVKRDKILYLLNIVEKKGKVFHFLNLRLRLEPKND